VLYFYFVLDTTRDLFLNIKFIMKLTLALQILLVYSTKRRLKSDQSLNG
jgi:hypothetical protein